MTSALRMPVLFIGHGNPMNAIEETLFTAIWRETAVIIPRPKGNIVHNLSLIRWHDTTPYPWALELNALATGLIIAGETDRLTDYRSLGEAARLSIPTNEHYLPLLYSLALQTPEDPVSIFADQVVLGSLSMQSVRIG